MLPRSIAGLPLADSPLGRTVAHTATDIWNDSCAIDELEYALSFGAVGATANPTIVVDVWNKDPGYWRQRVADLALDLPNATVSDLAWAVVEDMSIRGARLLEPVFEAHAGRQGRLSSRPTRCCSGRLRGWSSRPSSSRASPMSS